MEYTRCGTSPTGESDFPSGRWPQNPALGYRTGKRSSRLENLRLRSAGIRHRPLQNAVSDLPSHPSIGRERPIPRGYFRVMVIALEGHSHSACPVPKPPEEEYYRRLGRQSLYVETRTTRSDDISLTALQRAKAKSPTLGTQAGTASSLTRLFVVLSAADFPLESTSLDQLAEAMHGLMDRFAFSHPHLKHTLLLSFKAGPSSPSTRRTNRIGWFGF